MSEQINEADYDETAAAGDAGRRSSVEAAALTAGSAPSEQQLHSGSASRLSPKVNGGIIALLAASVLLISVGAFALTGGFGGQEGPSAQSPSQEAQTTEQGSVTATETTAEVKVEAESEMHSNAESNSSEQNSESDSAAGQNADSDSVANGNGGAASADSGGTAGGGSQPSVPSSGDSGSQASGSGGQQSPAANIVTVSVSVSSSAVGNPVSASGSYSFNPGATPYDALCALGLSVNARSTSYGTYVAAIGGLAEKEHGGTSGWMYSVNGSTPMTACTNYVLSNGDVVVWYYVTG